MSNRIKFIDTILRNIKPEDKRTIYWCEGCPGFGLRVAPSGSKSFVYKYMNGKQSRWVTIGKYPEWTIRQARHKYDKLYEQVREYGRDIVADMKKELAKKQSMPTVAELLDEYVNLGKRKGKVSIDEEKRALLLDLIPICGSKPICEVTSDDIDHVQNTILERGKNKKNNSASQDGKAMISHTMAYTRQLFNLAKKKGCIDKNPVAQIDHVGVKCVRERILDFQEIWLFWAKIERVGLPTVTAKALKFVLATMQRGTEVRNMTYGAYKYSEKVWHMYMQDTKNRTMHRVPLNKHARAILQAVHPYTSASNYVFGATRAVNPPKIKRSNLEPLGKTALSQAIRKKRDELEIVDFTPHDLRRTAATWITGVGLPPSYSKLMLNHKDKKSDVTNSVYIQYSYDIEKRKAVDIWSFVLDQIVTAPTVDDVPDLETVRKAVSESGLL